ncbi:hypothetical protein ACWGF2_34085, partial [Streptomyces sp. NPDC054919]
VSDSIRLFRVRFPVEAGSAFQFFAFAFPFPAVPTLPDSFSFRLPVRIRFRLAVGVAFAFRLIRLYQKRFGRANQLRGPDKGIDGSSGIQFPVSEMETSC